MNSNCSYESNRNKSGFLFEGIILNVVYPGGSIFRTLGSATSVLALPYGGSLKIGIVF
jgi:hypothetical protein